jgi:hypothetical protein
VTTRRHRQRFSFGYAGQNHHDDDGFAHAVKGGRINLVNGV